MKIEQKVTAVAVGLPGNSEAWLDEERIHLNIAGGSYDLRDAIEFRDALTELIELAGFGAAKKAIEQTEWNAGDPEPDGVTKVIDCDGDEWHKRDTGWHFRDAGRGELWEYVLTFAPLRAAS